MLKFVIKYNTIESTQFTIPNCKNGRNFDGKKILQV